MTQLPDVSDFYTEQRAVEEEIAWILSRIHDIQAAFVLPRMKQIDVESIIEFGCGSGILASKLPNEVNYLGIDKNGIFSGMARRRCGPPKVFRHDVRPCDCVGEGVDLAIAFDFLKHFSRSEWVSILRIILSHGRFGAINVQIADEGLDTGRDYHHIFVTEAELAAALAVAGHEEVEREVAGEFTLEDGAKAKSVFLWTRRVKEPEPTPEPLIVTLPYLLEVNGEPLNDYYRYTIRWVEGKIEPVLYRDGKRVCDSWRIFMDMTVPADERGRNANTT